MSGVDVSIALPEDETPGELIKGYFTLMRAFGWDLYVTSHFMLRESLGSQWFAARISELKDSDPKNWRPNHRFEPQDPGVILRDYIHEQDSPYVSVFGGQFQKRAAAKKILATRNTWFHFGDDPTTAQLVEAAKVVRGFVQSSGMHIAGRIDSLIERLDDLRTGRYPADAAPSSDATVPVVAETVPLDTPEDLPRPSIGGTWVGPLPELRYRITRAGDVVHPDTMESVRSRVTGDFADKVRAWTAVEPRGRELWIDTDGAVGGFIGASPRLLGYLGPDPESDIARGFFTPHFYAVEGDEIADLDSGERRKQPFAGGLADGATLRVTTYGDVLVVGDAEGMERVATVTPAEWFPGHLG
ncbi:hypothetical protein D8Y23_01430 [Microbacterium enclense]|uniref:Uncharacterized protein n=1 Tax=Microbacterium enclense TaxID=993073 RepID=A0A3S3LQ05_9MICO|nr:hypothetical protein [Microbacterium enclense]RWR22872.1 hypothetical protein D8Y23_01430 [Microbacterium enclense]